MRRVVITGAGVVSSLGDTPAALHAALCEGRSGISPVKLFDTTGLGCPLGGEVSDFDAQNYLGRRNLRPLDRTSRLVASAAQLALDASGWTPEMRAERELGLVLGTMFCSVRTIAEFDRRALEAVEGLEAEFLGAAREQNVRAARAYLVGRVRDCLKAGG